jgi:hypothetical protein
MTISEKMALLYVGGPIILLCLISIVWIGHKAKGNDNLPVEIYRGRITDCNFRSYGGSGQRRIGVDLILNNFEARSAFNQYQKSEKIKIEILRTVCENKQGVEIYYRRFRTVWFMEERNFWYKIRLWNGQEVEAD